MDKVHVRNLHVAHRVYRVRDTGIARHVPASNTADQRAGCARLVASRAVRYALVPRHARVRYRTGAAAGTVPRCTGTAVLIAATHRWGCARTAVPVRQRARAFARIAGRARPRAVPRIGSPAPRICRTVWTTAAITAGLVLGGAASRAYGSVNIVVIRAGNQAACAAGVIASLAVGRALVPGRARSGYGRGAAAVAVPRRTGTAVLIAARRTGTRTAAAGTSGLGAAAAAPCAVLVAAGRSVRTAAIVLVARRRDGSLTRAAVVLRVWGRARASAGRTAGAIIAPLSPGTRGIQKAASMRGRRIRTRSAPRALIRPAGLAVAASAVISAAVIAAAAAPRISGRAGYAVRACAGVLGAGGIVALYAIAFVGGVLARWGAGAAAGRTVAGGSGHETVPGLDAVIISAIACGIGQRARAGAAVQVAIVAGASAEVVSEVAAGIARAPACEARVGGG